MIALNIFLANFINESNLLTVTLSIVGFIICYYLILFLVKKFGSNPKYFLPLNFAKKIQIPLFVFLLSCVSYLVVFSKLNLTDDQNYLLKKSATIGYILSISWAAIIFVKSIRNKIVNRYDINAEDNLKARKIYTQFNILENIFVFVIILFAIGIALMSFENIRQIGISMLTSAGIAGIIIGFAAQKALATLLAGIQIAFTQPIRLEDVVVVEGEWGVIEEINLTYVVVKIWDKRRLVLPTTYFIEKPFQNWTRSSSDIMGTVFIYTSYNVPAKALRDALTNILENTPLWDKNVNVLQVTNTQKDIVELRALMSAKDSATAWDLRVHVREKLVEFLQQNYPESLPISTIKLKKTQSC